MRKRDLVKKIVGRSGIETRDVNEIVTHLFAVIVDEVGNGNRVDIRKFGCFQPRTRKAKMARDIARGKPIHIPEKVEPSFKHSKKFFTVKPAECTT